MHVVRCTLRIEVVVSPLTLGERVSHNSAEVVRVFLDEGDGRPTTRTQNMPTQSRSLRVKNPSQPALYTRQSSVRPGLVTNQIKFAFSIKRRTASAVVSEKPVGHGIRDSHLAV